MEPQAHSPGPVAERNAGADVAHCFAAIREQMIAVCEPGIEFEIAVELALPLLGCDPIDLQNALLNLVFNARDAMADRGTIRLAAKAIASAAPEAWVEIEVADNGVGMSSETVARAFELYFTTKSEGMGGVGLPMVERFVNDEGGTISVDSEIDIGTTVIVRLPALASSTGGQGSAPPIQDSPEEQ